MESSDGFSHYPCNEVNWFMAELGAQVVAESGVASDRYHLGKLLLKAFKETPDFVLQFDGTTGESYTNRQTLEKSVRCATAFRKIGIQKQDVVLVMAPNCIDQTIPYYASLMVGAIVTGNSRRKDDLPVVIATTKPKIIFCLHDQAELVENVLKNAQLEAQLITFDKGETHLHFSEFLDKYGGQEPVEEFKATDFDPEDTIAFLCFSSGSTNKSKLVPFTHKCTVQGANTFCIMFKNYPQPMRMLVAYGEIQYNAINHFLIFCPMLQVSILQVPSSCTRDHFYHLLKTYKPTFMYIFTGSLISLMRSSEEELKALRYLKYLLVIGSLVTKELYQKIKDIVPSTRVLIGYGCSEAGDLVLFPVENPAGSVGKPSPNFQYKLVDLETQSIIEQPNRNGELLIKGPSIFKGYFKQPEKNHDCFSEDGWFRTGDVMYRDENWNFFFFERTKFLVKHLSYEISPTNIENALSLHPAVVQVAIIDVKHPNTGPAFVAFVEPHPDRDVTAQEIKDLAKKMFYQYEPSGINNAGQGGPWQPLRSVVFVPALPLLAAGKVDRLALRALTENLDLE